MTYDEAKATETTFEDSLACVECHDDGRPECGTCGGVGDIDDGDYAVDPTRCYLCHGKLAEGVRYYCDACEERADRVDSMLGRGPFAAHDEVA